MGFWRRKWQVFLPGKFHGWRSLLGYSPWGRKESDMTERLHFLSFYGVREGEVQKKNETGPLQEQISFNEARRGSSQISELLP